MRSRGWRLASSALACCVFAAVVIGVARWPGTQDPLLSASRLGEQDAQPDSELVGDPTSESSDSSRSEAQDGIAALVAQCEARAEAALIADGEAVDRAKALAGDFSIIVEAFANKRLAGYDTLMRRKGASLNEGLVRTLLDREATSGRYSEADAKVLKQSPAATGLELAWSHPARRNAEWTSFDPSKIATGKGWFTVPGEDHWPAGMGIQGRDSIYLESKGRLHYVSLAQRGAIDVRWLQMPVTFGSAGVASLRFKFVYDEEDEMWYPTRLVLTPTLSRPPILLF